MSIVSIVKCKKIDNIESIKSYLSESIYLLGGLESKLHRDDRVLIKPNILAAKSYKTGATTNPYIIEALIDILRTYGIKKIVIGEGAIVGENTSNAFKKCGIDKIAERKNVDLVDLKRDKFVPMSISNGKIIRIINIPEIVINSDLIINIPVMKTHDSFPATLGLKNMKGVIQERDKKRFHLLGLAQCIVDLNKIVLPHITIVDGTVGMEGLGPLYGDPVNFGLIISSFDTVSADAISAYIMGINPYSIEYIKLAAEQGLGIGKISKIKTLGRRKNKVRRKFKRVGFESSEFEKYEIRILESGACSGCVHTLESCLFKLKKENKISSIKGYTFLMGSSVKIPAGIDGNIIKFGTCTRILPEKKGYYIPGCPPHMDTIREVIKKS